MKRPIDTLYYHWVLDEDAKTVPTVLEDIGQLDDEQKISELLEVYAHLVTDVIEAQVAHNAVIEGYIDQAMGDADLAEEDIEDVANAIDELPDVEESGEDVANCAKRLDLFTHSFTKAVVSEL